MTSLRRSASVVAAVIGVVAITGCETLSELAAGVSKPTASIRGVELTGLTLQEATLAFDVEVTNPYGVAMPLAAVDYGLSSGGLSFLTGSSTTVESIPARGSGAVRVPATVNFSSLLQTLQAVRPGATVPYSASLGVSVDTPGGRIKLPLQRDGEIPVPAVPEVTLESVAVQRLTIQEAAAVLKLRVVNQNTFPVDLSGLSYGLKLGGQPVVSASAASAVSFGAGGAGVIEIPITLNPMSMGTVLQNALQGGRSDYEISGSMDFGTAFGALALPFSAQGNAPFIR